MKSDLVKKLLRALVTALGIGLGSVLAFVIVQLNAMAGNPAMSIGALLALYAAFALLLAVLEKRANQKTYNQDVYINVAGGLELSEPAADLALCMAVVSSLKDAAIGAEVAVMGEVGLAGEVRAIPQCDRRISECQRLGFTTILLPKENMRRLKAPEGMKLVGVDTVMQAISVLF